jgi:branched-chain amino acid transport system substrate-binding protein
MRKSTWLLFLLGVIFLFAFQPLAAQSTCDFTGEPIRIGATGPLSAPGSVKSGEDMQWALNLAVEDVNAACGVVINDLQHPVELVFEDTAGTPEVGVEAATRLVDEVEVVGVVGEYHSAVALAMMDVFAESNTPVVFSETYNDNITAQGTQNVFRIAPVSSLIALVNATWLISRNIEDVVIIAENTDFGTGGAMAAQAVLESANIKVTVIFVEPGAEDFVDILLNIAEGGVPDAIDTSLVTGETNYRLVQQIVDLGIAPTAGTICIANQVAGNPEYWDNVPEGSHCIFRKIGLGPIHYNDMAANLAERYRAEFDSEPNAWVFEAYDSLWLMAQAVDAADGTDSEAIIAALEAIEFTGAQGDYYFEYTSDNPVPDGVPAYMWHQWPDPVVVLLQYTEIRQTPEEAAVIWPPAYQQDDYNIPGAR